MQGILILGLIFAIIIAIFSIQNAVTVSLSFFAWQFEISLVVVILGSLAIGTLMMGLFSLVKQFRLKKTIKKLQFKIEKLSREKEDIENQLMQIKNDQTNSKDQYQLHETQTENDKNENKDIKTEKQKNNI